MDKDDNWSYEAKRIQDAYEMMTDDEKETFASFSPESIKELMQTMRALRERPPIKTILESSTNAHAPIKVPLRKLGAPHPYRSMGKNIVVEDVTVNLTQAIRLSLVEAETWVDFHIRTIDQGIYGSGTTLIDD